MNNNVNIVVAFCIVIIAIALGFYFNEMSVFLYTGYYFILVSFLLWLFSLFRIFSTMDYSKFNIHIFVSKHWIAFVVPLIIMISAISISSPEIKILSDEANLIATSKTMYREHRIHMVMVNVIRDFGDSENVVFGVDKRGLFFPFLLSVTHTFLGYDSHNGFIVNILGGYSLLLIFYFFLIRWFSKESAILGVLTLSAYPIIIIYTLSSGFEILNVLFVVISFYLLDIFLEKKDWRYADALLLSLILLAQIRYESVLFALVLISTLAFALRKPAKYQFSFLTFLMPFLFLPVLWQRLLISDYQLPVNYSHVFSMDNLLANLPQWWPFFCGDEQSYGVIGIVFFMSLAGLILAIIKSITTKRTVSSRVETMSVAAFFSFLSVALVIMSYWSGSLVDGFVSRLSIVFIPLIVFFALVFIENFTDIIKPNKKLLPFMGLLLMLLYWPEIEKNTSASFTEGYRRYHLVTDFINANYPNKIITIIDPHTTWFNIHEWGAISFTVANINSESMLSRIKNNTLDELIVLQNISFQTGEINELYKLNDHYKLEELYTRRFRDDTSVRISKVLID